MKLTSGLALLSLLVCGAAYAQGGQSQTEDVAVEIATVPVCDTQEQVQRYIALYNGDSESAISAVNAEVSDPAACGMASVAYVRGPQIGTRHGRDMAFDIVRILVVGVSTPNGIRAVKPAAYFTVFGVRELDV